MTPTPEQIQAWADAAYGASVRTSGNLSLKAFANLAYAAGLAAQQEASGFTEAEFDEALNERDRYHKVADDLAAQIAAITSVEIGEHSSNNDPWHNAMIAANEFITKQLRRLLAPPAQPIAYEGRSFDLSDCDEGWTLWRPIALCDLPQWKTREALHPDVYEIRELVVAQPQLATSDPEGHRQAIADHEAAQPQQAESVERTKLCKLCGDKLMSDFTNTCYACNQKHWSRADSAVSEDVEEVIACLGDDAAMLRDKNPECEIAANMDKAASMFATLPAVSEAERVAPIPPDDEEIFDDWLAASDSDGIAYDSPSFQRGYQLGQIAERDAAPQPQQEPFKGWKMVPVEPTENMLRAGRLWDDLNEGLNRNLGHATESYRAMLAAAPAQPQQEQEQTPEQRGYVPLSDDGKSVFIDGIGEVYLSFEQPAHEPCIGKDSLCPCQDGGACHYKDCGDTKALSVQLDDFVRAIEKANEIGADK